MSKFVAGSGARLHWKSGGARVGDRGQQLSIGELIRRRRLALGLSQRELARLAGVSQSLIARIETGSVNPRYETLRRILDALEEAGRKARRAISIASSPVVVVRVDEPLRAALRAMERYGFSQLPVVDQEGRVVGTVFEGTILRAILAHGPGVLDEPVSKVMEEPLPSLGADASIDDVLSLLNTKPAVLIVDDDGRPVGIVTRIDVVRALASHGGLQWNPRGV